MFKTKFSRIVGIVVVAVCVSDGVCTSQEGFIAESEKWRIADVIELIVNIDKYVKFEEIAPKIPNLHNRNTFKPVDFSDVPSGKHSYYTMFVRSDYEGLYFTGVLSFTGKDLLSLHISGLGGMDKLEVYIKELLKNIDREHQRTISRVCAIKYNEDTIPYPAMEFKSDTHLFALRLIPSKKRPYGEPTPPEFSITIHNSGGARMGGFPVISAREDEKQQIFEESGLSRILDELGIILETEPAPKDSEAEN